MDVKKDREFPFLPRFGFRLFLKKEFQRVSYYGMGPVESYCDKHRASWHGGRAFCADIIDMHEDYIKPQENGSHFDCAYVSVEGPAGIFSAADMNPFLSRFLFIRRKS